MRTDSSWGFPAARLSRIFRAAILGITVAALSGTAARPVAAVTIDTVLIGNAGNAGEVQSQGTFGAVAYEYRIGKYEVTVGQYTAFLNAVAATDTYALYNASMATDLNIAGIARSGVVGGFTYTVIGSPNKPVAYVSWGDAARFANWLHNGQPNGAQGPGTTESGAYALNGATTAAALTAVVRSLSSTWFIPSENEWYKAAYHKNDGVTGNYWDYPTSTDAVPYSDQPPGSDAPAPSNTANFVTNDGIANGYNDGWAATGVTGSDPNQNYLTDVAAYTNSQSPYDTFDQGGSLFEWNEGLGSGSSRAMRGGSWNDDASWFRASIRLTFDPTNDHDGWGFRVASVPEPSTLMLAALGLLAGGLAALRRRFRPFRTLELRFSASRVLHLMTCLAVLTGSANAAITFTPGHIYASDGFSRIISEFQSDGTFVGGMALPESVGNRVRGLSFGPDGLLYVTVVRDGTFQSAVLALQSDGTIAQTYPFAPAAGSNTSYGKLAVNATDIYVGGENAIIKIQIGDPDSATPIYTRSQIYDVEILPSGNLLVGLGSSIHEITNAGAFVRDVSLAHFSGIRGIEYNAATNKVFVTQLGYTDFFFRLLRVDAASGTIESNTEFFYADDLFLAASGELLVGSREDVPRFYTQSLEQGAPIGTTQQMFVTQLVPEPSPGLLLIVGALVLVGGQALNRWAKCQVGTEADSPSRQLQFSRVPSSRPFELAPGWPISTLEIRRANRFNASQSSRDVH